MPFYESTNFNRQKPIGNYIFDFYCNQLRLVIEIDGESHGQQQTQVSDLERTANLESQGLTVLRFTNREVEDNIEAVMTKIEKFIEKGKSPQPIEQNVSLLFEFPRGCLSFDKLTLREPQGDKQAVAKRVISPTLVSCPERVSPPHWPHA